VALRPDCQGQVTYYYYHYYFIYTPGSIGPGVKTKKKLTADVEWLEVRIVE